MRYCLDPLIEKIELSVQKHRLGEGKYCRWLWQNEKGNRNLGSSEYGCADAANILYTVGKFPADPAERAACIRELQSFQHPDTGLFAEPTHHTFHSTAHVTAALELFEARPLYPLKAQIEGQGTPEKVVEFLDSLPWDADPWPQAHQGAGIFASMINTGNASLAWQDAYFGYLTEHCEKKTGVGLEKMHAGKFSLQHHLNGWFHYLFNFAYARRPFPCAKQLVDSLIDMYRNHAFDTKFAQAVGFAEIDWIYAIRRASLQEGYRLDDVREVVCDFARVYLNYLENVDADKDEQFNDLHLLFGATCALAELQLALPGEIVSTKPLRPVLDRRPFI